MTDRELLKHVLSVCEQHKVIAHCVCLDVQGELKDAPTDPPLGMFSQNNLEHFEGQKEAYAHIIREIRQNMTKSEEDLALEKAGERVRLLLDELEEEK